MKASDGFRSAPAAVLMDVTSIQPHESAPADAPRIRPPDSLMNVVLVFLKAFR